MSAEPVYQLRDVEKRYGSGFRLHVSRLRVLAGQTLGVLGPTGAGKSTLLRMLARLETATGGHVQFGEHHFDGKPLPTPIQRQMTMVFQRPLLLRGTVRTNVAFGLQLRGSKDKVSMVNAILERLALARLADQAAGTLSGGQTQLVALARALAIRPRVLLLDEPTASLDPAHVALVEQAIAEERQQRELTVVWATHNLFQVRRVADATAVLLDGACIEVSPTEELFENPSDPRTAAFVRGKLVC